MSEITDKTDYYEIFGVEQTATQDEIKRAYRKAAMKWHPDRNINNIEEATRVFQIIEHAYSILSDPHERAWYDGHRDAVTDEDGDLTATKVDIKSMFSATAYFGYNDNPNGFYAVFRKAFQQIADEEKANKGKIPSFGNSKTDYQEVFAFYNYWTCFTTTRSFAFEDLWRLRDAPNARYNRAMKQENEKIRQKAQREFVTSVREMALYAKKRDPRIKKHDEEVKQKQYERQRIEEEKKLERQRKIQEEIESYANETPIQFNEDNLIYLKEFEQEQIKPEWHCDYCGRDMDSESAFRQHCKTKKHKKAVYAPHRDFLIDDSLFEHNIYTYILLGLTKSEIEKISGIADFDLEQPIFNQTKQTDGAFSREGNVKIKEEEEEIDEVKEVEEEEEEVEKKPIQKKLSKKERHKLKLQKIKEAKLRQENDNNQKQKTKINDEAKNDFAGVKLSKKEKKKLKAMEEAQKHLLQVEEEEEETPEENCNSTETQQTVEQTKTKPKKEKKPKQRRAPAGQYMCRKCHALFTSKNKLFQHLEETKHATVYSS